MVSKSERSLHIHENVSHRKQVVQPDFQPAQLVASSFNDTFDEKFIRIRKYCEEWALKIIPPDFPELYDDEAASNFITFSSVSFPEVERI